MAQSSSPRRSARVLSVAVVVVGALAVLAAIAFWPRGEAPDLGVQPSSYVDATVRGIDDDMCQDPEIDAPGQCQIVTAELTSGPDAGDTIDFEVRATQFDVPELDTGDEIVLLDVSTSPPQYRYSFADFQRSTPLVWLVVAFAAVVIAFGRWQGVRALVGLAASGAVLIAFLVPALLRDEPAVPVALAATVIIGFIALYLAHGVNVGTTVALAGTLVTTAGVPAGPGAPTLGSFVAGVAGWRAVFGVLGLMGLGLGVEPAEEDTMQRPPRRSKDPILNKAAIIHVAWTGVLIATISLLVGFLYHDPDFPDDPTWQTMIFATIGFTQIGHALGLRATGHSVFSATSNKLFTIVFILTLILHLSVIYVPVINDFFDLTPLKWPDLALSFLLGSLLLIGVKIERRFFKPKFFS